MNIVSTVDRASDFSGASMDMVTPDRLKFAAASVSAGVGGTGAVVVGYVAPVPVLAAAAVVGGCLYAAHRMENGLSVIPGRDGNNAPATPVDATPVAA